VKGGCFAPWFVGFSLLAAAGGWRRRRTPMVEAALSADIIMRPRKNVQFGGK
jgi:MYXO-CTERM domain-containing protein